MKHLIHKLKELLKDIWEDFKTPMLHQSISTNCCSYGSPYSKSRLQPESVRVKDKANNRINKNPTL